MYRAHVLPAGSNLWNIVFRYQIPFEELDHGFQFTISESCLLILPDIPALLCREGFHRSFSKMQCDLFDLSIISVRSPIFLFLLIIEVFRLL